MSCGLRRLSLGSGGSAVIGDAGPLESASGAFWLLADARLDNREDFLPKLGITAADSAELSDTRLMLLCFERWGAAVIEDFVGDFALVLWDRRAERLLLARDFAGQRPLHFHRSQGAVAVASMASGLHRLDFVPAAVNQARMLEMLVGVPHEGRSTFFQGVERVEPGAVVVFDRAGEDGSRTFWTPPAGEISFRTHRDYAEALLEKLDGAVNARLRGAGAKIATHLSAGLDSSAVMSSAALQSSARILAYTSVPPDGLPHLPRGRFGNEGEIAARTAAIYPTVEHRLIETGDRLPLEALDSELRLFERPDLNIPNLLWSNKINDAAQSAGIGVLLTGNTGNATISYGGSEILGRLLAQGELRAFLSESRAALRSGMRARTLLAQAARQLLPGPLSRRLDRIRNRAHPAQAGIANPSAPGIKALIDRHERRHDPREWGSIEARARMITRVDPGTYNKGVLMRWGIDLRDATADRRVTEFCLQVPLAQYFRHGVPRALIRTALDGRVPDEVRHSRERGLQSPHWFSMLSASRPEAERMLAGIERNQVARRLLAIEKMRRLLAEWPEAPDSYGPPVYRYGLLRGLSAGQFVRLHESARD